MTAKKNQKVDAVTEEAKADADAVTEEAIEPNEDGFIPGQPVSFEQVMATQRKKRNK